MHTKLKPGYLLYRNKWGAEHAGVYLGNYLVLHNSPAGGVEVISYSVYADGKPVKVIAIDKYNQAELAERLSLILQADASYHVVSNNCEHIANWLIHGRSFSPQLQVTDTCALLGGVVSWKTQRGNPLVIATLAGLAGCFLYNATRNYDAVLPASTNGLIAS